MTTAHSNRIITIAERNAMLGDGVSNAELKTLLSAVDTKGVPAIDRGRIVELVGKLESTSEWPFGWIKTEDSFNRGQAIVDLKHELAQREQNIAGNAEHVGRYIVALNQYQIRSGKNLEGFHHYNNDLRAYLGDVLSGKDNSIAEKTQNIPNLAADALKALTCEYAEQIMNMNVTEHQCPTQPQIPFRHVHGMPVSGRML